MGIYQWLLSQPTLTVSNSSGRHVVWWTLSIRDRMLTGPIVCSSPVSNHRCCETGTQQHITPPVSGLYTLPNPPALTVVILLPGYSLSLERGNKDSPLWPSIRLSLFSTFGPVTSLHGHHLPLGKEASVTETDSTDLWAAWWSQHAHLARPVLAYLLGLSSLVMGFWPSLKYQA